MRHDWTSLIERLIRSMWSSCLILVIFHQRWSNVLVLVQASLLFIYCFSVRRITLLDLLNEHTVCLCLHLHWRKLMIIVKVSTIGVLDFDVDFILIAGNFMLVRAQWSKLNDLSQCSLLLLWCCLTEALHECFMSFDLLWICNITFLSTASSSVLAIVSFFLLAALLLVKFPNFIVVDYVLLRQDKFGVMSCHTIASLAVYHSFLQIVVHWILLLIIKSGLIVFNCSNVSYMCEILEVD